MSKREDITVVPHELESGAPVESVPCAGRDTSDDKELSRPRLVPNPDDLAEVVAKAAAGDAEAWNRIVARFSRLLWAVVRSSRLNEADASDAVQNTWLRLLDNLSHIRAPQALPAWLATTARREAVSIVRVRGRDVLTADDRTFDRRDDIGPEPAADLMTLETNAVLAECVDLLPARSQLLLRLLMEKDRPNYSEIASLMGMPVGSIGPTRLRILRRLREALLSSGYPVEDLT
jgi:RNA polymerase sigma factor (sigma-70 family)